MSAIRQRRQAVVSGQTPAKVWRNRITGTTPIVFHAPGKGWSRGQRNELWKELAATALRMKLPACKEIRVITWNNGPAGILEQQLARNGQAHTVLGQGVKGWKNSLKTYLTCEALKSVEEPYVLGLDAFDVFYAGDLTKTIGLLERSGKKLVQNADAGYWPSFTPPQYKQIDATPH